MDISQHDPNYKQTRLDEPELDLYTIPISSSWFAWDEIHETEKVALKEFFDGSSFSRTPKIYKEYRDFIINKYREDPSRRLTFTEVRKSLVGDVCFLHKVFLFLEKWGLINFGLPLVDGEKTCVDGSEEKSKFKIEEGVPNGVRVVATPNSIKPISAPLNVGAELDTDNGFRLPPLASCLDVFADLMEHKGPVCGNCGDPCDSGHYKHIKDDYLICIKCFKDGNFGENKFMDDFKLIECIQSDEQGAAWTEAETLLLLESVLKHGDDWELVAQSVQSKTKLDCINKLIEMPFGEVILASAQREENSSDLIGNDDSLKTAQLSASEHQETVNGEDQCDEPLNEIEQKEDAASQDPPVKRQRISSFSDSGSSLMKQVALISTMAGPRIAAAAAEAAVTSLCEEHSCSKEIFDSGYDSLTDGLLPPVGDCETKRVLEIGYSEMQERPTHPESEGTSFEKDDEVPLTLRIRAAIATALGAAAAHAKLLADQEEREIEHLMAMIIETQMKKLQCKIKHFDDLELIMRKKHSEIEVLEDSLLEERINVLWRTLDAGVPRWKDHSSIKS